jgi:hypothetical protein
MRVIYHSHLSVSTLTACYHTRWNQAGIKFDRHLLEMKHDLSLSFTTLIYHSHQCRARAWYNSPLLKTKKIGRLHYSLLLLLLLWSIPLLHCTWPICRSHISLPFSTPHCLFSALTIHRSHSSTLHCLFSPPTIYHSHLSLSSIAFICHSHLSLSFIALLYRSHSSLSFINSIHIVACI